MGIVVMGTGQEDKMRILCYDKAKAQVMAVGERVQSCSVQTEPLLSRQLLALEPANAIDRPQTPILILQRLTVLYTRLKQATTSLSVAFDPELDS